MRNITVFAVLVIILYCAPAQGQEESSRSYAFSVSPCFGFWYGQAEEIVYPPDSAYSGTELYSQLLWDMKPVLYTGMLLDFARLKPMEKWGFFAAVSLKGGIPGGSGKMEDRDWLSAENDALTHYSIHDNVTGELMFLDMCAGVSLPIEHILLVKPYITASYMRFSFSGNNGNGNYPWGTADFSGMKVITYTQDWYTITPGISLGFYFLQVFYAELFFQISPLIFCVDEDRHLTTNTQYLDYMRGGLLMEPGFHGSYYVGEGLELSLDFTWRHINGTRGETWHRTPIGTGYYFPEGEAGSGLSLFDTGLCLKITL